MKKYFKFVISLVVILNFINNISYASMQVPNENKTPTKEVDRLQKLKEKGALTVLSSNEQPYSYRDPKTGEFSGIDADIIREVAKRLGIEEVRVKYLAFINIFEELFRNPNIDLIANGIFITDERKQLVNFTNPVYTDSDAILTREDSGINDKKDLKNVIIGVNGGTIYESMAEKWKQQGVIKDYEVFYDNISLELAIKDKIVRAILTASIIGENIIFRNPESNFRLLSPNQYKPEIVLDIGYPLKKEDTALLNAINEKLQEMKNDGTLYEILVKHGISEKYVE